MSCGEEEKTASSPFTGLIVPTISSTSYTTTGWQIKRKACSKQTDAPADTLLESKTYMHEAPFKTILTKCAKYNIFKHIRI